MDGKRRFKSEQVSPSAESILTLKNRESIHFGYFCDMLREKNRFMIHEPIHTPLLQYNGTWHFMYRHTRFAVFKNRLDSALVSPMERAASRKEDRERERERERGRNGERLARCIL